MNKICLCEAEEKESSFPRRRESSDFVVMLEVTEPRQEHSEIAGKIF